MAAAGALAVSHVQAQDLTPPPEPASELETVVVAATAITVAPLEAQKDIPKSVSIVSGAELESLNAVNVTDIFQRLGNIRWNYGNPTTGGITVRGITTSASFSTIDPSLGTIVDGVPYGTVPLAAGTDYVDVDTIAVTRGPQGSQGGQNTTTGSISIVNKAPTFTPEAYAILTLGERNALVAQAAIGGPVIDGVLAWRASFSRNQQQGEYFNYFPDNSERHTWGNVDRTLGRAQLLWTPSEDLSVLFSVNSKPKGIEYANGLSQPLVQPATFVNGMPTYIANGPPNATNTVQNKLTRSYFTDVDPLAYENSQRYPVYTLSDRGQQIGTSGGVLKAEWKSPFGTLTSITGYQRQAFQASNSTTAWDVTSDGGYQIRYHQGSEELSLTSSIGELVDYKTGLYYFKSSAEQDIRSRFGSDAGAYNANWTQYSALATNLALLKNSLDRAYTEQFTYASRESIAAYANLDWHVTEPLTVTTGFRFTRETRETSQNRLVTDYGFGAQLNPAAYGGFNSNNNGLLGTNSAAQLAIADAVALKYFGVATYGGLSDPQRRQVGQAKGLRAAQVFSQLYGTTAAQPYKGNLPSGILSGSYKLNDDLTTYVTWQRGVKAGISQISNVDASGAPISRLVDPETSNAFELGIKGDYFGGVLFVNADVFYDILKNFQQTLFILDPVLTAQNGTSTYTSISGNAPRVIAKGVEIDAAFTGIKDLTLRFAGAYNDAYYDESILLAKPAERGNETPAFYDANGQRLQSLQKFSLNLSGVYTVEVGDDKVWHLNANYHWGSARNGDASQSIYSRIGSYGLADIGVGYGRRDGAFDANIIVKNALDKKFPESLSWTGYTPGNGRWVGLQLSARL